MCLNTTERGSKCPCISLHLSYRRLLFVVDQSVRGVIYTNTASGKRQRKAASAVFTVFGRRADGCVWWVLQGGCEWWVLQGECVWWVLQGGCVWWVLQGGCEWWVLQGGCFLGARVACPCQRRRA